MLNNFFTKGQVLFISKIKFFFILISLSKGKLATNAQLVEKAVRIVDEIGYSPMTPAETRQKLKLVKHK